MGSRTESEQPFVVVEIPNWDAAKSVFGRIPPFLFRGHADLRWPLDTSFHRAVRRFGVPGKMYRRTEAYMLRDFQRRAHHYLTGTPSLDQDIEWLALMQHHGGQTRLLDFTYSPYVALFFAIEMAEGDAAVWGINAYPLREKLCDIHQIGHHGRDRFAVNSDFLRVAQDSLGASDSPAGVIHVEPARLNERMAAQQGTFLMPTRIEEDFEANLLNTIGIKQDVLQAARPVTIDFSDPYNFLRERLMVKFIFPRWLHAIAMLDLIKMNVTAASLFHGLDGFARSLQQSTFRVFDIREPESGTEEVERASDEKNNH